MSTEVREAAESFFKKLKQRREAEIDHALQRERAKYEETMKNMERLRSLRLQRDAEIRSEKLCAPVL